MWGSGSMAAYTHNHDTKWRWSVRFTPVPAGEEPRVPLEWVTGWASVAVWLLWRREKPLAPSTDWTTIPQMSRPYPDHYTNGAGSVPDAWAPICQLLQECDRQEEIQLKVDFEPHSIWCWGLECACVCVCVCVRFHRTVTSVPHVPSWHGAD